MLTDIESSELAAQIVVPPSSASVADGSTVRKVPKCGRGYPRNLLWKWPARMVPIRCLDGHVHLEDTYPLEMHYKISVIRNMKQWRQI